MDKPAPVKREGFWSRQFSAVVTIRQTIFDVVVGAIIPILLLIFDPAVFRNSGGCYAASPLTGYAIFAYIAIGLGVMALLVWLFAGTVRQRGAAFFAGVFIIGGLLSTLTGVVLLPLSVIGLLACIGALGFFPFLTAFVYFRNGVRAWRIASLIPADMTRNVASMCAALMLTLGLPALVQAQMTTLIQQSVDEIAPNNDVTSPAAVDQLKTVATLCLGLCNSTIAQAFEHAGATNSGSAGGQQLARLYLQVTGQAFTNYSCSSSSSD